MLEKKLELVHLQLTKSCNLRCWFCGQWGEKGFFADSRGQAMGLEEWLKVVQELTEYKRGTGIAPSVILWGGEPLLAPYFDEIARTLHEKGFPLGLVTNGTLIHLHEDTCRNCFHTIYLSVDGPEEVHDAIRGKGVYARVKENRRLLSGSGVRLIVMSVLTRREEELLVEHVKATAEFEPDELLLQEMIGLSGPEVLQYKRWMGHSFGRTAGDIDGWRNDEILPAAEAADQIIPLLPGLRKLVPFPISYLPHGEAASRRFCLSPWRHMHVAWNGDVMFCTDFYDFAAGNVKEDSLTDIFGSQASEKFREEIRAGNCAACGHCSWRNSGRFGVGNG